MTPGRGFHTSRAKLPRLYPSQRRNLSSALRPDLRTVSIKTSPLPRTTTPWTRSIPIAFPCIVATRHASTTPVSSPGQAAIASPTPPTTTESASISSNIDTITLDNLDAAVKAGDTSAISEGIGHIHSLGIDYGFGPTTVIQNVLEHVHVWGDLPWWASILVTAASLRLLMFPLFFKSSDATARQNALSPVMKPFMLRMTQAQQEGNLDEMRRIWSQLSVIRQRAGISYVTIFTPMILQGVLGWCGFRLMKALATLPVPGFKDGGFLWVTDLTLTDGYLLLPLMMAATTHVTMRLGGEMGASQLAPGMQKFMIWGMPAMIFVFTAFQPGAVALWFAGSGAVGLTQARLLQQKKFREYFGLAPIYKPKSGDDANPLTAMMSRSWGQAEDVAKSSSTSGGSSMPIGKNAAFMRPTYQSPNVNINSSGRTIDVQKVDKGQSGSEMVQPTSPAPGKGIVGSFQDKLNDIRTKALKAMKKTPEQQKAEERRLFKKRAEEYEKRAAQGKKR